MSLDLSTPSIIEKRKISFIGKGSSMEKPMRTERILLLILACLPLVIFGCASVPASTNGRTFYFSSGGAYHFEGYGEWIITLDSNGSFTVKHNVNDEITDYGSFTLSDEENTALWNLVDAANIHGMKSSERPGLPDEAQYTFALTENGSRHEVQVWIGEAREIETFVQLVTQIGALIEAYTGQSPVLN